jgi:fructose-specific phosphotransferase system IIA component
MKLVSLLSENLIKVPLKTSQKVEVIKELLALLTEYQTVENAEEVLEAILEREEILSTGLGNGVAIPHCKSGSVENFSVALGIHPRGVDFQSLDQQPAYIIFLLVGPENKPGLHIRLLSRISRIISREDVRQQILRAESSQEVYYILEKEELNFIEINT